jgi:hypothetical protein
MNKKVKAFIDIYSELENNFSDFEKYLDKQDKKLSEYIRSYILSLSTDEKGFLSDEKLASNLAKLQTGLRKELGLAEVGKTASNYLESLYSVAEKTLVAHFELNSVAVAIQAINPIIETNASTVLSAITKNDAWRIDSVKNAIARAQVRGQSKSSLLKEFENLAEGKQSGVNNVGIGKYGTNIQRLAHDATFQSQSQINELVQKEGDLQYFFYVGSLVVDSRPLCRHLVKQSEPTLLSEIPSLIERYPEGLYRGTNKSNFLVYRGGYNCRHFAVPTNDKNLKI